MQVKCVKFGNLKNNFTTYHHIWGDILSIRLVNYISILLIQPELFLQARDKNTNITLHEVSLVSLTFFFYWYSKFAEQTLANFSKH